MPGTPIGDAFLSVGADLSAFNKQVADAVKNIKPINLQVTTASQGQGNAAIKQLKDMQIAAEKAAVARQNLIAKLAKQQADYDAQIAAGETKKQNAYWKSAQAQQKLLDQQATAAQKNAEKQAALAKQIEEAEQRKQNAYWKSAQQQANAQGQVNKAQLSADLIGKKHVDRLNLLTQAQNNVAKGSVEYLRIQRQINVVHDQMAGSADKAKKSMFGLGSSVQAYLALHVAQSVKQMATAFVDQANAAELTDRTVRGLAGTYASYTHAIDVARKGQSLYGGSLQQNEESLSRLIGFTNRYGVEIAKIDNLIRRLAASDPEQGVAGAAIAIRESLSGDITSISRRFEIPRIAIRELSNQLTTVPEKVEILDNVLNQLGVTQEVLAAQTETNAVSLLKFKGALQDTQNILGDALAHAFRPITDWATHGLSSFNRISAYFENAGVAAFDASKKFDVYIGKVKEANALRERVHFGVETPELTPTQFTFGQSLRAQFVEVDKAYTAALRFTDAQIQSGEATAKTSDLVRDAATAHRELSYAVITSGQAIEKQKDDVKAYRDALAQLNDDLSRHYTGAPGVTSAVMSIADQQVQALQRNTDAQQANEESMARTSLMIHQAEFALGPYQEAVENASDAVEQQSRAIEDAERALQPYRDAVDRATDAVDAQQRAIRDAERALQPFKDAVEATKDAVDAQQRAIQEAERALEPFRQAVENAQDALETQKRALDDAEQALQPYRDAIESAQEAVDAQNRAIEQAERALRPYQDAVRDATRAVQDQQDALDAAERALKPFRDAVKSAERAVRDQQDALDAAEKALQPYRDAVKAADDAVRDQQDALEDAERALKPYRDAVDGASVAVEKQQRAIELAERALRPFEDAVRRAQQAEENQSRAIEQAERALRPYRDAVESANDVVTQQQRVIELAERALRPYQDAVDAQKESTDRYKESLDEQNKALDEAKQKQAEWANVPLTGSQAFSDQLFDIDQQVAVIQKKLLDLRIGKKTTELSPLEEQLMRVNDQVQETALRLSHLRTVNASPEEIARAEQAYRAIRSTQDTLSTRLALQNPSDDPAVKQLEQQMQDLQDQAEGVRLTEKITLDPLRRQQGQFGAPKEMSFEDIVKGYQQSTEEVDTLTTSVTQATTEWEAQNAALDEATAALKAQQDALEPLKDQLVLYQDALSDANDALAAQDALIDSLRDNLVLLKDATQAANDALERQQDAIQPLRDQLVGLQDTLSNAQAALDAADKALDPMREHLDDLQRAADAAGRALEDADAALDPMRTHLEELQGVAEGAARALEGADEALDPMRQHLEELQGAADAANRALQDQQDLIIPLRDALIPLTDALAGANAAYKDANDALDPLRENIRGLEGDLRDAQDALKDQDKLTVQPLRDHLVDLQLAYDNASRALEDHDKLINPLREKLDLLNLAQEKASADLQSHDRAIDPLRENLRLLEDKYRDTQDALEDQIKPIDDLKRKQEEAGLRSEAYKVQIDALKKSLYDLAEQQRTTANNTGTTNNQMQESFRDTWSPSKAGSIAMLAGEGAERTKNNIVTPMTTMAVAVTGPGGILDLFQQNGLGFITTLGLGGVSLVQTMSDALIGENGLFPGISNEGSSGFGDLKTNAVTHMDQLANGGDADGGPAGQLGVLGIFGGLHTALYTPGLGTVVRIVADGIQQFLDWKGGAVGAITDLVGSWEQGTGVMGGFHSLWTELTDHADTIKDALLSPFTGAGAAISGIMAGFGDTVINGLNVVLGKIYDFGGGIKDAINWISQKILGRDVIEGDAPKTTITPINPNAPDKTKDDTLPGLASGTDNWSGGWAQTGEEGAELALLPPGGNPTYLPPGTKVLPHGQTRGLLERGQGETDNARYTTQPIGAKTALGSMWDLVTGRARDILEFVTHGPMNIEQALGFVHGALDAGLPAPFDQWDDAIRLNMFSFARTAIKNAATEAIRAILPKEFADQVIKGIPGGATAWRIFTGAEEPAPGEIGEPPPNALGQAYPTGIGTAAAIAAIMDGAYLTQHFSAHHPAIDIGAGGYAAMGKAIHALIGGRVISSGYRPSLEGQYIITEDAAGRGAYYGHMVQGSERFGTNDIIMRGSVIGGMGMTGAADAPHVHFEMRLFGRSVNPEDVFAGRFVWPSGPDTPVVIDPSAVAGAFWPGTPPNAQQWLMMATRAAGVGDDWLQGMSILGRYESGWYPRARNLNDSNYPFHPSRGITQTIPETFNAARRGSARMYLPPYSVNTHLPGQPDTTLDPGDIYDPIENIIASINYIRRHRNYGGHVNNLPGVHSVLGGGGWIGYANGGLLNEPVVGRGMYSGRGYTFGEQGHEMILSRDTTDRLISVLSEMDSRSRVSATPQPSHNSTVVEERHYTYNLENHQHQRTDSERDLISQVRTMRSLFK